MTIEFSRYYGIAKYCKSVIILTVKLKGTDIAYFKPLSSPNGGPHTFFCCPADKKKKVKTVNVIAGMFKCCNLSFLFIGFYFFRVFIHLIKNNI